MDPAHPFPYISGLSLNLAVVVRNPQSGQEHFARVKVPPLLPRFTDVGDEHFVPLEDVIAAHLEELFPGMEVLQHRTFRVTRNEDLDIDEDEAENLLQALERELMRRRLGRPSGSRSRSRWTRTPRAARQRARRRYRRRLRAARSLDSPG